MSSLNQKMINVAQAIRDKRMMPDTAANKLSLDEMVTYINLLEHDFWKQVSTGTTTYTSMNLDLDKVASHAFYGLQGIETMTFTNNQLTSIGNQAFKNCSVKTLTLPSSVESLGESMFAGSQLTSFTGPGVKNVGEFCFANTRLVQPPTLSSDIEHLPRGFLLWTAHGTSDLKSILIPSSCKTIGAAAYNDVFWFNKGTPNVSSSKQDLKGLSLESLGSLNFRFFDTFYVSTSKSGAHTVFNFPKLETLKHCCFKMVPMDSWYSNYYAKGYYNFNFNSLKTMGHNNFTKVPFKVINDTLFPSLTSFGQGCFCENPLLTEVNLSNVNHIKDISEESIKGSAYNEYFPDDFGDDKAHQYAYYVLDNITSFGNCPALKKMVFPALTEFKLSLEGSEAIETLDLGESLTYIETFYAPSLKNLVIRSMTPPQLNIRRDKNYDFIDFPNTTTIYVPDESLSLYNNINTSNWNIYVGQFKPLSEYAG